MLLRAETLKRIQAGTISIAFRRWRRPTVRPGGTLLTPAGQLQIIDVAVVDEPSISEADALQAGYPSRAALLAALDKQPAGSIYRIEFGALVPDPRIELRETVPKKPELELLLNQLDRLDRRAEDPWTGRVLEAIARRPGNRSAELCRDVGMEQAELKSRVRKLKALGLTISLEKGYRLSRRGEALLELRRS